MMVTDLGMCLATGTNWLNYIDTPKKGVNVLYAQTEVPDRMLQERVEKIAGNMPLEGAVSPNGSWKWQDHLWLWTEHYLKLDQNAGYGLLTKHVKALKPSVVIIDPLYSLVSGSFLKVEVAGPFLDRMNALIANHHLALVIVAHPRKGEPDQYGADDLMGSSLFADWADTVIRVTRQGGGTSASDNLKLEFKKARHAVELLHDVSVVVDRKSLAMKGGAFSVAPPQQKR